MTFSLACLCSCLECNVFRDFHNLRHCQQECKMVRPLRKSLADLLRPTQYDLATPLLRRIAKRTASICPPERCTPVCTAALFTIAKNGPQPSYPYAEEQTQWEPCPLAQTDSERRTDPFTAAGMNPENVYAEWEVPVIHATPAQTGKCRHRKQRDGYQGRGEAGRGGEGRW